MNRFRDYFPMSDRIAAQLIRHNHPGLTAMALQQPPKEALRSRSISLGLQIYINNFAILVNGSPQVMLFATNLHKDFINVEGVTISLMPPLESPGISGSEFNAP
jgi:hypothetical protein